MILVDTSVWVDHFRANDAGIAALLGAGMVLAHPFVIGELAMGSLRQRGVIIAALRNLPQASVATDAEVLRFVDDAALFGMGIGYVDAHLLAATRLTPNAYLITRDRRLRDAADRLNLSAKPLS